MSKHILLFGAGKSATCLIDYLVHLTASKGWQLTVCDQDQSIVQAKTGVHAHVQALALDVHHDSERNKLIGESDIVLSLLPPALHLIVAKNCLASGKHLITASYTSDDIRALADEVQNNGILFLCEMGLDPGIDHMSAMDIIHRLQREGCTIESFVSHCGGLVAPACDDNPWHYKISWNPRNVVTAGKDGATFLQQKQTVHLPYQELFTDNQRVQVPGLGELAWYPNRDSLSYIPLYGLGATDNFIRTTLRYPAFCSGWRALIELQLVSDSIEYNTDALTLKDFFQKHINHHGLAEKLARLEKQDPLLTQQLNALGRNDDTTRINRGRCSAMDVLQFALENKLALRDQDRDMIVMLHQFQYTQNGKQFLLNSSLVLEGENNSRTAMATTVGLPMGIAAKLVLEGKIQKIGLCIPVIPEIYLPVLEELRLHGIIFQETIATR